jgi:hypothetical protein
MLQALFGWKSLFMETALLYNLAWLVSLYFYIALCHCMVPVMDWSSIVLPMLTAFQCWMEASQNGLSIFSGAILSFTSSGIYETISWLVRRWLVGRWARVLPSTMSMIAVSLVPISISVVAAGWTMASFLNLLSLNWLRFREWLALASILFMYALLVIQVGMLPRHDAASSARSASMSSTLNSWLPRLSRDPDYHWQSTHHRRMVLVIVLLPVLPFLLMGDVVVILLHAQVHSRIFLILVAPIVCWVMASLILDPLPRAYGKGRVGLLASWLRWVTVLQSGSALFGQHYGMGLIDAIILMIRLELLEMVVLWFMGRHLVATAGPAVKLV